MRLHPEATLSADSLAAVADAFGLGEPLGSTFVARGAMGAVNRICTLLHGERSFWTVKRSYWNHFGEDEIRREVDFTRRCGSVGVPAPRSIQRVDGNGYVLALDDQSDGGSQYRVLDWVLGETGRRDDSRTILPIAEWMARIHNLAAEPNGQPVDEWFVRVKYDWDDLAERLKQRAPDITELVRASSGDLRVLTDLVNRTREPGAIWCHTDIVADNLIWSQAGPQLIDWENGGPLVPHQELGCFIRSVGPSGMAAYRAYRRTGGPAEITEPAHLASSVATHLNYLGCQSELLLDDTYPEQHDFATAQVTNAVRGIPSLAALEELIEDLGACE